MVVRSLLQSGEQDQTEVNEDRITNLPWHIQNIIYEKMSIVDAIRMSVLAKDWRYKWLSLSDFSLDVHEISDFLDTRDIRWDIVASIVNNFLLHHTGPIRLFSLKSFCSAHYPDMYQWLQYLSEQNVEVLVIQEYGRQPFVMPSHLFSFQRLHSLFLTRCSVRIPSEFRRFNHMTHLFLSEVAISDDDINYLIFACPILGSLTLLNLLGVRNLSIVAPRLEYLKMDTRFETIAINAPQLVEVIVTDAFRGPWETSLPSWENIMNCLRGLGSLSTLTLYGDFIKLLSNDFGLVEFPLSNTTLTALYIHRIRFEKVEVFAIILSLLCTCPNIRDFGFSIEASKGPKLIVDFIKEIRGRNLKFPELKSVTVSCLGRVGMGATVHFIEFIVSESPNLEYLTIIKEGMLDMNQARLTQMLARFRRCCPHASVRYMYNGQFADV